jgi:hypothetical protein
MADESSNMMATSILMERRAHKLAADDALRLYNRVRQLHKEEHKAHRRIQDTRKKAKEIIRYRERNELSRQEKLTRQREQELLVEQQRQQNLQAKEVTLRNREREEARIWEQKASLAAQTKEERMELEQLLEEMRLMQHAEAVEHKQAVQRAHEDARRKIEQLKTDRLLMVTQAGTAMLCGIPHILVYRARGRGVTVRVICRPKRSTSDGYVRRWMPRRPRRQRLSAW